MCWGIADQDHKERQRETEARNGSIGALCIKNAWLFTAAGQHGNNRPSRRLIRAGRRRLRFGANAANAGSHHSGPICLL